MSNKPAKSILDEAYNDAKAIEEALKLNAKDLLSSTMKTDLEELVKESLEDKEDTEIDNDPEEKGEDDVNVDIDADDDEPKDDDVEDIDIKDGGSDTDINITEPEIETEPAGVVDMTNASDEDVLKVFKKMGPDDGIIVKRDSEGNLDVKTDTEEFKIMTNETEDSVEEEGEENLDTKEDGLENDEVIYELNLDGLDEDVYESKNSPYDGDKKAKSKNSPYDGKNSVDKNAPFDTKDRIQVAEDDDTAETEMKENKPRVMSNRYRTTGNNENAGPYTDGKRQTRGALKQNEEVTRYKTLVETLKKENQAFKKGVEDFKNKLHEVAVFNSNLAYTVRLFTENSTSKKEKINILRRFDNVKNLAESKNLFETIQKELGNVISENKTVDEKIIKTPQSSTVETGEKTRLIESKIYEDPKFKRTLDIMKKINK